MATFNFTSTYFVSFESLTANFVNGYSITEEQRFDFASSYNLVRSETLAFSSKYQVRPQSEQIANFTNGYLVYSPLQIPQTPATITVTIRGETIDFDTITDQLRIAINTSGSGYTCTIVSQSIPDGLQLTDAVQVNVGGNVYNFIFDRLQIEEDGLEAESRTLTAVSPVLAFGLPRARAIDFTNNTARLASDIVRGLLGSVDWQIVDWLIPEFRLAVTQQTPLQIAQDIAKAAGGLLTSDRAGNPVVKYRYPVSALEFDTATPDKVYNTFDHVFSRRANLDPKNGFNSFLVTDVSPGQSTTRFADVLDFDLTSRSTATITAYLSPVRDVVLRDTAPETIGIQTLGERVQLQQTEDIEIRNGSGQTRRPIDSIVSMNFLSMPLTGVAYTQGATEIRTQDPEAFGLVRVVYNTIANQYRVSGITSPKVQFLLKEA